MNLHHRSSTTAPTIFMTVWTTKLDETNKLVILWRAYTRLFSILHFADVKLMTRYATTGERGDYDWGDMELGFLDIKGADAFEPVKDYTNKFFDISHGASITLIKIRLLIDLKALQNSALIGDKIPQEILDKIRSRLVSTTIVAKNRDIMESKDQTALIEKVEKQIKEMYTAVKLANQYFWPAVLRPGNNLTGPPQAYSRGSREHMRLALGFCYESWAENPEAMDVIRELVQNDKKP
jgi:hypothetical protein